MVVPGMSRSPSPTGTGADGSSRAPDPTGPVTTSSPPVRFITSTRAGEHRPADCFIPLRQIARTPPGSRLPLASTPPPASGLLPASIPSPTRMSPAGTSPGRSFADAVRGSPAAGKLACVSM
ncbi:serine/arginine repetitive matrix protein 1-like [Dysidea avara]|uniref:serine/arginine repetitive matrix protein 1-like n=1 Tax=Dysidea avara TaxID=196820 RepID=UPI00332F14AE